MQKSEVRGQMPEVYCHYVRQWIPLGRARKYCPRCGAAISIGDHELRVSQKEERKK